MGPYRGVARPGACFAIERLVDEVARELGREPFDLRRQNIVTAAELPYTTAAGMKLDTGDYVAALDIARDQVDAGDSQASSEGEPDGRKIGVGFAFYTEQSGHGIAEFAKRKFRVIPGYESAQCAHAVGRLVAHLRRTSEPRAGARNDACADRRSRAWYRSRGRSRCDTAIRRSGRMGFGSFAFALDRVRRRAPSEGVAATGGKDPTYRRASVASRCRRDAD